MSTSDLKLSLVQRLLLEQDATFLRRIKDLFDRRERTDVDFTDEELSELREIERKQESGEDAYVSMEDAMRMAREALGK
jgi:Ran GTPase-activating protein (RanGAP) involved in mRNA processing and transport